MLIKASELRLLDVINLADGRKLGHVIDLDLDADTGQINALILAGAGRLFFLFQRGHDVEIPWSKILRIGVDVILVDIQENRGHS
ncbi:MAG: YlmC/YmxH family sporulation protein [Limnochordia bacterium]|jgi:YlmC/YmxH family sporulation protein